MPTLKFWQTLKRRSSKLALERKALVYKRLTTREPQADIDTVPIPVPGNPDLVAGQTR